MFIHVLGLGLAIQIHSREQLGSSFWIRRAGGYFDFDFIYIYRYEDLSRSEPTESVPVA